MIIIHHFFPPALKSQLSRPLIVTDNAKIKKIGISKGNSNNARSAKYNEQFVQNCSEFYLRSRRPLLILNSKLLLPWQLRLCLLPHKSVGRLFIKTTGLAKKVRIL
jgi:hypothetical protein